VSRPFEISLPPEQAWQRNVLFAVEVLDAVTLERVSEGLEVEAEGLRGEPVVNTSGLFVWLAEDFAPLRKVTIDPRRLPYERFELPKAQVQLAPAKNVVELRPRADYPFTAGTSGLRGALIETRPAPPSRPTPVAGAEVRLLWLDEDAVTWREAPVPATTGTAGDFVAVLRFAPAQMPLVDTSGALSVRLLATRGGVTRTATPLALPLGRVADPSTFPHPPGLPPNVPMPNPLIFAWDELTP
jgi:hypothetical protein